MSKAGIKSSAWQVDFLSDVFWKILICLLSLVQGMLKIQTIPLVEYLICEDLYTYLDL